jgi:hypothetical protein
MLVSTSSCIQKYTKLFTIILSLRMLCDLGNFYKGLGSSQSSMDISQAWSPTDFDLGSDLDCDFCQKEESLDLMKDLTFCPSCSRLLQSISEAPNSMLEIPRPTKFCSPQSSHLSNEPSGVIQSLARSQRSFLEAGMSDEGCSTKLLAVAKNLRDNIHHSKRSVNTSFTLGSQLTLDSYAALSSLVGRGLWMS